MQDDMAVHQHKAQQIHDTFFYQVQRCNRLAQPLYNADLHRLLKLITVASPVLLPNSRAPVSLLYQALSGSCTARALH